MRDKFVETQRPYICYTKHPAFPAVQVMDLFSEARTSPKMGLYETLTLLNRPCILGDAMALVRISTCNCCVTSALHAGTPVGRSWTSTYKDMTLV